MSSCVEVGKGSIGVRLSTICFLHWVLMARGHSKRKLFTKSFLGVAGEGQGKV